MKKSKFNKKLLPISLGLSFAITVPVIANACSSTISQKYLDKLVSKSNGDNFYTGNSLADGVKSALKSEKGMDKFASQIVGQALLNFYEYLGSDSSVSIDKAKYKKSYDDKMDEINTSLTDLQSGNKSTYKGDYPLVFQQNELDPHGGSEEFWKKEQQIDWAISQFKDLAFSNLFVALTNNDGTLADYTSQNLLSALNNTNTNSGLKFSFTENALDKTNGSSRKDKNLWKFLAKFQEFVFNQWVQSEAPFLVNQVSWNYSNPQGGLIKVYQPTAYGTGSLVSGDANYNFPYFGNANTNDGLSDSQKFLNFVNSNSNFITDDTSGIRNIPTDYSSATEPLKLVTNRKAYTDLNAQSGLAATYLFANSFGGVAGGDAVGIESSETYNQASLKKSIKKDASDGFDVITSNFISSKKETFKNSATTNGLVTAPETYVPYTEISASLAKQILKNNPQSGSGDKQVTDAPLYAIDAFIPSDANLSDFIFVRTSEGVSALAIDGAKHIKTAKNLTDAKQKAGEVVLYRYLENQLNNTAGTPIDLKGKLSSFFTENFNTLIFKFWNQNQNDNSLNLINFSWLTTEEKNLVDSYLNYIYVLAHSKDLESYQIALYSNKNTLATNYGDFQAKKNGLAAQFPYEFTNASKGDAASESVNKSTTTNIGHFKVLDTVVMNNNPFGSSGKDLTDWTNPYSDNGAYSQYIKTVDAYVNTSSPSPLTSTFEGFKYSQYVLSNNYFVNEALIAYGGDDTIWSNQIKSNLIVKDINKKNNNALTEYDGNGFKTNNFNIGSFNVNIGSGSKESKDIKDDLNSALSNFFFNSTFDSSANKWVYLNSAFNGNFGNVQSSATAAANGNLPTITYTELDKYRQQLWMADKLTNSSSSMSEYYNFVTLVATIQYLLEDNGSRFISELQNKLAQDESTFIVWESSVDKSFDKTSNVNSSQKLLYGEDGTKIVTNVNNSQATAYYPNSNTSSNGSYVDTNTSNSTFNSASNYYTHVSKMNGFQGIQTSSGENISTPLKEILFETPWKYNSNKTGLLYGIANSRQDLLNKIDGFTFTNEVDALANKMQKLFPEITTFKEVNNLNDLQAKKDKLKEIIDSKKTMDQNSNYVIPDDSFKPRNGYINSTTTGKLADDENEVSKLYKDDNNLHSKYEYGSYVIQINSSNLKDFSTFYTYLQTTFNENKVSGMNTNIVSQEDNSSTEAWNLIANLLVSVATTSSIQTEAIDKIAENNKIDVYDIRLNNGLGEKWVTNWKDQEE